MSSKEQDIPVKVVDRRWWARGDDGDAPADRSTKPTYVEELERQLAEKDKTAQEYIAKYRQAASEFEESRLQAAPEISKDVERARREILCGSARGGRQPRSRGRRRADGAASPEALLQGVGSDQKSGPVGVADVQLIQSLDPLPVPHRLVVK